MRSTNISRFSIKKGKIGHFENVIYAWNDEFLKIQLSAYGTCTYHVSYTKYEIYYFDKAIGMHAGNYSTTLVNK